MSKEAMRLALEALKQIDEAMPFPVAKLAQSALREALAAQPAQQEPVAVVSGYYGGQCVILPIDPARIFNSNTALYTSPPASKPLTDEEIVKITSDPCLYIRGGDYRIDIARAIEAAHGIKE